jgi:hypothetical protein
LFVTKEEDAEAPFVETEEALIWVKISFGYIGKPRERKFTSAGEI